MNYALEVLFQELKRVDELIDHAKKINIEHESLALDREDLAAAIAKVRGIDD